MLTLKLVKKDGAYRLKNKTVIQEKLTMGGGGDLPPVKIGLTDYTVLHI